MHSERQPHGTSVSTLPELGPPQRQKMTSCWPSAPPLLSLPASGRARSGHRGRSARLPVRCACACAATRPAAPSPRSPLLRHSACRSRARLPGRARRGARARRAQRRRDTGRTRTVQCRPSMAGQPRAPASCAIPSLGSPFGSSLYNAPATGRPPRRRALGAAEPLRPALRGASGGALALPHRIRVHDAQSTRTSPPLVRPRITRAAPALRPRYHLAPVSAPAPPPALAPTPSPAPVGSTAVTAIFSARISSAEGSAETFVSEWRSLWPPCEAGGGAQRREGAWRQEEARR